MRLLSRSLSVSLLSPFLSLSLPLSLSLFPCLSLFHSIALSLSPPLSLLLRPWRRSDSGSSAAARRRCLGRPSRTHGPQPGAARRSTTRRKPNAAMRDAMPRCSTDASATTHGVSTTAGATADYQCFVQRSCARPRASASGRRWTWSASPWLGASPDESRRAERAGARAATEVHFQELARGVSS